MIHKYYNLQLSVRLSTNTSIRNYFGVGATLILNKWSKNFDKGCISCHAINEDWM